MTAAKANHNDFRRFRRAQNPVAREGEETAATAAARAKMRSLMHSHLFTA